MVSSKSSLQKTKKQNNILKVNKIEKIKKKKPPKITADVKTTVKIPKNVTETKREALEPEQAPNKIKVKYVMPSKSITDDLVNSCLNALEKLAVHYKKNNKLFDDETPIFSEIHCMKIQSQKGNIKFTLPHSTSASTGEICLITPDLKKGRKIDHEPTVDHWEEVLRKADVTSVKTVLPVRQLKVEYDQFELKRRLLTQHDFIMVDTRVLSHVSHLLGNMFFKKHNMLIPVRLEGRKDIKKAIDAGLRTAMLRLNDGETSSIMIGHTGMPQSKLKENIMSLVDQLRTKYPGGEANIRSLTLKLPLSLSLPLYITLRPSSTVHTPKLKQKRPKHSTILEDELSTMPGRKVRVAPDGTVRLIKIQEEHSDVDEFNEAEEPTQEESDKEATQSV